MNNSISLGGTNQEWWSSWYRKVSIIKVYKIFVADDVMNRLTNLEMRTKFQGVS